MDIARRNLNSGVDLANSLAGAKNLAEIVELQAAYWRKQFSALTAQAEEVPALSTKVVPDAGEPLKGHLMNSMDEPRTERLRRDGIRHGPVLIWDQRNLGVPQ
jgi:hypothetical protein